jgi:cytochrome c peroxidase
MCKQIPMKMVAACAVVVFAITAIVWAAQNTRPIAQGSPALAVKAPADNPTTPEKVALGRLLFWDPILSGNKDVACATCHHPEFGYSDGLPLSIGVNGHGLGAERRFADDSHRVPFARRNSQTIVNTAFNGLDKDGAYDPSAAPMFWDLRARSLEAQALEPLKAFEEMRGSAYPAEQALDAIVARLRATNEYTSLFGKAFGGAQPVTAAHLGKALAAFERTIVAMNSPYDRYTRGDVSAMTALQVNGMEQFRQAGCANCHSGPMFSDFKLHVLGVPDNAQSAASDTGSEKSYAFRTPSLRNLAYTAPYMHSGVFASLNDVVRFYNRGGRGGRGGGGGQFGRGGGQGGRGGRGGGLRNPNVAGAQLDPLLAQVRVRGRGNDIIAFLGALNDDSFDKTIPAKVPSGLPPGGAIH